LSVLSAENVVGLIVAVLLVGYLIVALILPEKF
jgi:K+-transporting ATPase KdpF subunit